MEAMTATDKLPVRIYSCETVTWNIKDSRNVMQRFKDVV